MWKTHKEKINNDNNDIFLPCLENITHVTEIEKKRNRKKWIILCWRTTGTKSRSIMIKFAAANGTYQEFKAKNEYIDYPTKPN